MATVRDLLLRKGPTIVSVAPTDTVLDAAILMNDKGIGGVVVCEAGVPVGIFTERDIMRRVVAARLDPAVTRVSEVMTADVVSTTPETPMAECRALMTSRRIRHLPVSGSEGLVGMITTGDILAHEVLMQGEQIDQLQRYVFQER
jgi:CBS domain-containing protein